MHKSMYDEQCPANGGDIANAIYIPVQMPSIYAWLILKMKETMKKL